MINRMQKWIYVIILLTGYSIRSYTQKTINLNIPVEQNWMFDNEHPVRFTHGHCNRFRQCCIVYLYNLLFRNRFDSSRWRLSQSCISHSHESHSRILPGLFHCRHRHSETFLLWIRSRTDFIQTGWSP